MKIALIDADLIGRKRHRFPNLALMKLSGYFKSLEYVVELKTNYDSLNLFDKVYISKVFTDTLIADYILKLPNVKYGGTGFFFDKAPNLPDEVEHFMPDYELYTEWVQSEIDRGIKPKQFDDYLKNSIGFTTRGCFRKCSFCVNRKYDKAFIHSPVSEFLDNSKPRISLWDDNFLACADWRKVLNELKATNKEFQFRQGLDIRLLNDEKAIALKEIKYFGDYIFAFDFIEEREIIESKLKIWKKYNVTRGQNTKLYVFCGFDRNNKWDLDFWKQDIIDVFERIKILMKYNCKPYIMRFIRYEESPYRGMYINIAQWCNQPQFFGTMSYKQMCDADNFRKGGNSATKKYNDSFEKDNPEVANKYFDLNLKDILKLNS